MKEKYMIQRNILSSVVLVIIGLCSGCSQGPTEPEYVNSFFPLEVGNKWYYNSFSSSSQRFNPLEVDEVKEIIGIKQISEKKYYLAETKYYDQSGSIYYVDTSYYRYSKDTLYQHRNYNNASYEIASAIFSLEKGDRYMNYMGSTIFEVTVREKDNGLITFFYDSPQFKDTESEITFQKGKGISKRYTPSSGIETKLIKADLVN
jgi:hypothetical protein